MKKWALIIVIVISGLYTYLSFDTYKEKDNYIEACFFISSTIELKRNCYSVYPQDHEKMWATRAVGSGIVFLSACFYYWLIKGENHV